MTPIVTLILSLITQLPQDIAAIQAAYAAIKATLSTKDQQVLEGIFAALNAKTDADVAALDANAEAHGAT